MTREFIFRDENTMNIVCGANDSNIPYIEALTGSELFCRGLSVVIDAGDSMTLDSVSALFSSLVESARDCASMNESDIFMEYQNIRNSDAGRKKDLHFIDSITVMNRTIKARSDNQRQMMTAMAGSQVVFAVGPAGTGKTFLAIAHALSLVFSGQKQKIVLTRPVVEAGESLGFLPGDLSQKLNPYLKPLYDSMEYMLSPAMIKRLEENLQIEVAPLAYMRGRSLNNCVVILDEAQNTTRNQMKMFLTRLGENAMAIVTGDVTQTDLPRNVESGLVHALKILDDIDGLEIIRFSHQDVVRSRIVKAIINAYDKEGQKEER